METGKDEAIKQVLRKAHNKESITVAAFGGSITEGFYASSPEKSYAGIVKAWWENIFKDTAITYVNAGIGATDSYLGEHRVHRDILKHHPDFMVVDFTVNDHEKPFFEESYDRLMRTLLSAPDAPAILLLFMTMEDGTSAASLHRKVAARYDLPVIDYKTRVLSDIEKGEYTWQDISPDDIHPNDRGHEIAGGMICSYLNELYDQVKRENLAENSDDHKKATKIGWEVPAKTEILDNETISPVNTGGFIKADLHPHLHKGWVGTCKDAGLEFELSFANLGMTYLKSVSGGFGKADIFVDGVCVETLDGDFTGGFGDYGQSDRVYVSDEKKQHHVIIKVKEPEGQDEKKVKFGVLALLVS
ncbi:MAG: SGNH/GDSL hydrolase family protein [Lachnospiraceae bacterium]|nr:SGNH/GDSL hydrolase family protein [Lachnospiraceae bacterium]